MRYFKCLLISLYLAASTLAASDIPKFSPAEQEVLKISQVRREANNRRDLAASARFVAEDCVFSGDDGVPVSKSKHYEVLRKLPTAYDRTENPRDFLVHIYGETAVVNFRSTAHEQFGDTDIISEQRATETWYKKNATWLLVAVQWVNIPVNFRKPVAIDPKIYADYIGKYEWRPGDRMETVYLKDRKLWSHIDGDSDEYLPAGGDSFFVKEGDLGTSTFTRDANGQVTGYVYHRIDGQEIHIKKIK